MIKKEDAKHVARCALKRAHSIRAAVEERDRVYRAAPSGAPGDLLNRLRANSKVRKAVRGDK